MRARCSSRIQRAVANEAYFQKYSNRRNVCDFFFYLMIPMAWMIGALYCSPLPSSIRTNLLFAFIVALIFAVYLGYTAAYYDHLIRTIIDAWSERNVVKDEPGEG